MYPSRSSIIAGTISALSACGGGLDDVLNKAGMINATGKVDKTEFLGTWVISTSTARNCVKWRANTNLFVDPTSQKYTFSYDQVTVSFTAGSNFGCKGDVGDVVTIYSIQWIPIQFTARQNVAGVSGPLKSATLAGKDATSIFGASTSTTAFTAVLDVLDGELALGKQTATVSADGRPTEISEPFLIRGK